MDEEKYTMTDKPMERSCEDQAKEVWKKLHNFIYHEKEDIQIIKEALQSKQKTIEELRAEVARLKEVVALADKMIFAIPCPQDCHGGAIPHQYMVTQDESAVEWERCQWCDEAHQVKQALSLPLDEKEEK